VSIYAGRSDTIRDRAGGRPQIARQNREREAHATSAERHFGSTPKVQFGRMTQDLPRTPWWEVPRPRSTAKSVRRRRPWLGVRRSGVAEAGPEGIAPLCRQALVPGEGLDEVEVLQVTVGHGQVGGLHAECGPNDRRRPKA
jgi:hypothetical protein